jgi:hypothetical protein
VSHRIDFSTPCCDPMVELHHLTPLGILHMAAFVTLWESFIGIVPHFNLWSYLFWARLQQGSGARAVTLGNVDILVDSRPKVDPYFSIRCPTLRSGSGRHRSY